MNRNTTFFILLLYLCCFSAKAQDIELGILGGLSGYYGDLSPELTDLGKGTINYGTGVFMRFNTDSKFTFRSGLNLGRIQAADINSSYESQQKRNLSFRSDLLEFHVVTEYNFLNYQAFNFSNPFSPYLFAGVAVFKFNPKGEYNGVWYELQPLGTEGQGYPEFPERRKYYRVQVAIPFGFGFKYAINERWNFGVEFGMRKLFTDYLDDVSTTYVSDEIILKNRGEVAKNLANQTGRPANTGGWKGDPNTKDWYGIGGINLSYNFFVYDSWSKKIRFNRRTKCPVF